jgi:catechol 2,3-dioxygenase-like lactoylglutathione lyase family enzyme
MTVPDRVCGFHHVAVQVADLANSVSWYQDFLGCELTWSTDRFSELTRKRLTGITRVTELALDDMRFHLFERTGCGGRTLRSEDVQFQHVCLRVNSPTSLQELRRHWFGLFESGRYAFAVSEPPSEIVTDDDGTKSLYCLDVNGLEFEFTYSPELQQ